SVIDADYAVPWGDFATAGEAAKRRYSDLLWSARFILCPRGQGTGSIRLFEVLKAGRVPIIISDEYVLPQLRGPTGWSDGALIVGEGAISEIPALIQRKMEAWPRMAANARRIWEENFAEETIIDYLAHNLAMLLEKKS